jgi:NDP-sugar pyrophosphorylase family protein
MRPRTLTLPKSLLEVAGRPFVDWQLEAIARSGYETVLLCIGHLGEQIEAHVGNGKRFGLEVQYSPDGPKLLGTAGAIRRALDRLEPTFLVTYGDSYLPFDYSLPLRDLQAHPEALGTMSAYPNEGRWDASNTRIQGEYVASYSKSDTSAPYIDYGATALRREVIAELAADTVVGLDSIQERLAKANQMRVVVAEERFYEIGSEAGLLELDARCRRDTRS